MYYINIVAWLGITNTKCKYNGLNHEMSSALNTNYIIPAGMVYTSWDLTTLFLYIYKIISFRKMTQDNNQRNIFRRIKYILNRIIILTILYEIGVVLDIICIMI